jgi:hypothetical protein
MQLSVRFDRLWHAGTMTQMAKTVAFVLVVYFGLLLIPEGWPAFRATPAYFIYVLTLPLVLLVLIALGCWGAIGLYVSRRRNSPRQAKHRSMLTLSVIGLLLFASAYGLSAAIRGGLPSGSHLQRFDSAQWKAEAASEPTGGDISVRQKMLGDVVNNVLPGRDRRELEQMLGPTLDTPYFASTGRDLIYSLGRERDSMFGVDSEWLLIWLDGSGRFERYEVWTD